MTHLTDTQRQRMLANGQATQAAQAAGRREPDHWPVVKLFTPDAQCTWLLTELDPEEPDIAFGLCDLGMGFPELGRVSLAELESVRGKLGLMVERDAWFQATQPLSAYTEEARRAGGIVA